MVGRIAGGIIRPVITSVSTIFTGLKNIACHGAYNDQHDQGAYREDDTVLKCCDDLIIVCGKYFFEVAPHPLRRKGESQKICFFSVLQCIDQHEEKRYCKNENTENTSEDVS